MNHSYCIDVSGSMSSKQIKVALDRASRDWKHGDKVFVFDHATAMEIPFHELVDYVVELQDLTDLYMRLFKRGARHKWCGSGVVKACILSPSHYKKVVITDGLVQPNELSGYQCIIKV